MFDNGEHVCCVNMDLHLVLQVFKVIELKLGPQLKDLKKMHSVDDAHELLHPFTTIWPHVCFLLFFFENKTKTSAGSPALGIQSGFKGKKTIQITKFFVNGDSLTCNDCLHSSA